MLTQAELQSILVYYPNTGQFFWQKCKKPAYNGTIAGYVDKNGYWIIKINGKKHAAHRLAWLYIYGEWPEKSIDHANNDKIDNRICNLRKANQSQQNANRAALKTNKLGIKGVRQKGNKYQALICKDKTTIVLGTFNNAHDAHEAYIKAARKLYGEFSYE